MSKGTVQLIVITILVLFFGYFSYRVVQPFLAAIAWAVVIAIVSHPLYIYLLRHLKRESVASLLNLAVVLVLILGPVSYFMYLLTTEIGAAVQYLQQRYPGQQEIAGTPEVERFVQRFLSAVGIIQREATSTVLEYAARAGQHIAKEIPKHATLVATTFLDLFLMSVVLFFLPSYGPRLLESGLNQIPLPKRNRDRFKGLVRDVVLSAVYGGLFSGVGHGALALVTFAIAGVPSPVLLGLSAAFLSVLPVVGSLVVWFGVVLYLIGIDRMVAAIVLAIVSVVGTQVIDHFLRPWLSKGKSRVPFVIVLFGILGGLEYFGFAGFVLGPLVLAIFIALLKLFGTVRAEAAPAIEEE